MILLLPVVLGIAGLYTGRLGLIWLAIGLFVWLTWARKAGDRTRVRLWSVPADTSVQVSEIYRPLPLVDPSTPGCGCA